MGLFWDSTGEKEANRKEAEATKKKDLEEFLKRSDQEKFAIIFNELKRIDEEIKSVNIRATIGMFT